MLTRIIKRDGSIEEFTPSKLNKWSQWAASTLNDRVDWSSIVLDAMQKLSKEQVTSRQLQQALIDACLEREDWPYNLMAGRLYSATLQKDIHGDKIPTVKELIAKLVRVGLMRELDYSDEDLAIADTIIDHTRDFSMAHFQVQQIRQKFSAQNRVTGEEYETSQFTYMRMALALGEREPHDMRMTHVKNWYDLFSRFDLNAPTPNYNNLGTPHKGYASCCLINAADNLPSLAIGEHISYMMTAMSAGIGSFIGSRSIGDPVRNGSIIHNGKFPYYVARAGEVKANTQGGRGGADNEYYMVFDPEATDLAQCQSVKAPEDKKIRQIHFTMQSNRLFAKKVSRNEDIFTFNCYTAPDLWQAFFTGDQDGFERLYQQYEDNPNFKKTYINARSLLIVAAKQAHEVATHYEAYMDEINRHTPFVEPIYSSNLCVEVTVPTAPYHHMLDLYSDKDNGHIKFKNFNGGIVTMPFSDRVYNKAGKVTFAGNLQEGVDFAELIERVPTSEVGICNLFAVNIANDLTDEQYRKVCYYGLKMIDNNILYSDYPLPHVGYTAKQRMNAGVGIIGLAYYLAKRGLKYDTQEGLEEIHRVYERHAYIVIEQSLRIAEERGNAPWIHKTRWPEGWLPIDTYKKSVDDIVNIPYQYPWEELRARIIKQGGIGHSSLIAHMPTETSSKAAGVPNSGYPVRELAMKKTDQSKVIDWCAKDGDLLADQYQLAYDISTMAMINVYAVQQKFTDQSLSADHWKNRVKEPDLSVKDMVAEYLARISKGMKTRYYQNSKTSLVKKDDEAVTSITTDTSTSLTEGQTIYDDGATVVPDVERANEETCVGGSCKL